MFVPFSKRESNFWFIIASLKDKTIWKIKNKLSLVEIKIAENDR